MQVIRSIAELDARIAECDLAGQVSDDALRAVFLTFRMDRPAETPADPFSDAYREFQLRLYASIAGREYRTANEVTAFDVGRAVDRPFPYYTGSCATTGEHLMAIGFLLRAMALPPGSRVLEFGPGWGNTTMMLAKLGHQVTAVDIEPHFCELLRRRAEREGVSIEVVNDDFLWAERAGGTYDAVLFFESFHHCADHLRLLRALRERVAPEGRLFFGCEPIHPGEYPWPWGLRLDGQSLWAIRKNGWFELGFDDAYFAAALKRTGWASSKVAAADPGWMNVWTARRRDVGGFRLRGDDGALGTGVGERREGAIMLVEAPAGTAVHGPYVALPVGRYMARLHLREGLRRGTARMDVSADAGERSVAGRPVNLDRLSTAATTLDLAFETTTALNAVEVRLFCDAGLTAVIETVEIELLD